MGPTRARPKASQEREPTRKQKSMVMTMPRSLAKLVKTVMESSYIDPRRMVPLKSGTQKGSDFCSIAAIRSGRKMADSMECYRSLRNNPDLLSDGKTLDERRLGEPFVGLVLLLRGHLSRA